MERMTEWNDEQTCHAYYPRCFEEPCYGGGAKSRIARLKQRCVSDLRTTRTRG